MICKDENFAEQIFEAFWADADLRGLLLEHQQPLYDSYYALEDKISVWLCSRRFGKSAGLLILAFECGLSVRGAKVRYGAATQKMVEEIIEPLIHILIHTAPAKLKPHWVPSRSRLYFPSQEGSYMVVSGLDEGRANRLRGTSMHLGIVDEAQGVDDLDYVVKDVLLPQTLTTGGRMLLSGTAPKTPAHTFTSYVLDAERKGTLRKRTIYDDSRPEVLARIPEFMEAAGGETSSTWRREYLVEIVTDESHALIPEMNRKEIQERLKQVPEKLPPHFIAYTVLDLGYIDYTGVIFGYVDFLKAQGVILDELLINRKHSKEISDMVREKEKSLWGEMEGLRLRRYADAPLLTIADFNDLHKLAVTGVSKDELEAQLNELRLEIVQGHLRVHPRCVQTHQQLQFGIWDDAHRKFARSSQYGHFDLVAACMYFVRHWNLRENPYPSDWGLNGQNDFVKQERLVRKDPAADALKGAFRL